MTMQPYAKTRKDERRLAAMTDMLLRETRRNLGWRPPKRYARVLSKMAGRR